MNAMTRRARLLRSLPVALLLSLPVTLVGTPAAAEAACDEVVATHAPDRSEGDVEAVAITSQVLVADVDGWESVSWEVDEGADLGHVVVSGHGGDEVVEAGPTGHVGPATALTFCADADAVATSAAGAAIAEPAGARPLFGASLGAMLASLVLLLSRGSRRDVVARTSEGAA